MEKETVLILVSEDDLKEWQRKVERHGNYVVSVALLLAITLLAHILISAS